ncbi:MAG: exodeoxyribonuclease VII small subunit [Vampirovibrionales bacterium]|nr:exodeoxyribonuclease VII small subunit [Vampirovibrionales bacterium]
MSAASSSHAKHAHSTDALSFSDACRELQAIVEQFKNGQLPLEEALALYEAGIGHLKHCQTLLNTAQGKVQTLDEALNEALAKEALNEA